MSCKTTYQVELENVREQFVQEAADLMKKELNINYNKQGNKFEIRYPSTNYPMYASVDKKGNLQINGDSDDRSRINKYSGQLKQFYEAVELSHEFGAPIDYNKETQEIQLLVTV